MGDREPRALVRTRQWLATIRAALTEARVHSTRTGWYQIRNAAADSADLWIYDEIGMWGQTAADFVAELAQVSARRIDLHLNSPGGECFDGIAIYNALRSHPAQVHVHVDSLAASIASVIAMAGDRIEMGQGAQMMIHDAAGLCFGNATDMTEMASVLDRFSNEIAGFYAARAGGQVATWRKAMRAETWYSGAEAVAAGLADALAADTAPRRPADGPPMDNRWDLSMFRYAGRDAAPTPEPVDDPAAEPPPAAGPPGRAFPRDHQPTPPPQPPPEPAGDGPVWGDDMADLFTAAMADELDDELVGVLRRAGLRPEPVATEPDVVIDVAEFYNAVREGTT